MTAIKLAANQRKPFMRQIQKAQEINDPQNST